MSEMITVTGKAKLSIPPDTICEQAICYTEDNLDIEPDVLELTDVVTITWDILS